jgi:Carbohydrate-binding module family 5/12
MPEFTGRLRTPRLASAPSSPAQGELYFDTATNKLYWYNGTAWVDASGGAAGGGVDYIGDWSAATTYKQGDVVRYAGVDYIAVNPSTNQAPTVPTQSPSQIQGLVPIERKVLAAPAASIDFQNIPQYFSQLMLVIQLRGTDSPGQISNWMRFNNDAVAGNYGTETLTVYASTASANEGLPSAGYTQAFIGNAPSAAAPAGLAGVFEIIIPNYTGTVFQKAYISKAGNRNGTVTTTLRMDDVVGHWLSTAAINRITILPNAGSYVAGSVATLYGILDVPMLTAGNVSGQIGTAFPSSPIDGQRFTLVDSLTAPTYAWECRYVASITDAYKWLVIGPVPLRTLYGPNQQQNNVTSPADLGVIVSLTMPRSGIYIFDHGAAMYNSVNDYYSQATLKFGAAAAGSGEYAFMRGRAGDFMSVSVGGIQKTLVAGDVVKQQYWSSGSPALLQVQMAWIEALPVRLS